MNDPRDINDIGGDLEPGTPEAEVVALQSVADRLHDERPVPAAGYRSRVRSGLIARGGASVTARPARLRIAILGYAGSGALLLLVAAVGLAGIGPFGA
jgi:hypothetical protein